MPLRLLLIPVAILALVIGLLGSANRDTTAPKLAVEVVERAPATLPFDLTVSADEPVDYFIKYADVKIHEVAQHYSISLLAVEGENTLEIDATDGAGNVSQFKTTVYGIETLKPKVEMPITVQGGKPIGIRISWPEAIKVGTLAVLKNGQPMPVFFLDKAARVIDAVELGSEAKTIEYQISLTDEYRRDVNIERKVNVLEDSQSVEELNISADTLSAITPEGRQREKDMLEHIYSISEANHEPKWTKEFILPISGHGTSGFGVPRRYVRGGNVSYHHGEDIGAGTGTKIAATNDGTVLAADYYPIKGGFVAIDHGAGVMSFYFHQSKLLVEVGQEVKAGDIIGEVGSTGLSTGPHLHWEMRVHRVATDPMEWVGKILPD